MRAPRFRLLVNILLVTTVAAPAWLAAQQGALLTAPGKMFAGGRSSVTVVSHRRDLWFVPIRLELVAADGSATELISVPGGGGPQMLIEFDVPTVPAGAYRVRAKVPGFTDLEAETQLTSTPALLIETDKPVYKPAQSIEGRVIRLDNGLRPQAGPVEVTFFDAKGIRIARQNLEADEFGVAPFSLQLASEVNMGVWQIEAASEDASSLRDIRVENFVLPRFEVDIAFDRSWALESESISGTVSARYFFGKDVEGRVALTASRWVDDQWRPYADVTGDLKQGSYDFELPPAGRVNGTRQQGEEAAIRVDIVATDTVGNLQKATDTVTVTRAPLSVRIHSTTPTVKGGRPVPLLVTSTIPDGSPIDADVRLRACYFDQNHRLISEIIQEVRTQEGIAEWTTVAPEESFYADFEAFSDREGMTAGAEIRLAGTFSPTQNFLSLTRIGSDVPAAVGSVLNFRVDSTASTTLYYEVFAGGRTVFASFVEDTEFSFPVSVDMAPAAKVVAYQITPGNEVMADKVDFDVALDISATLAAGFSADQVKPGDPVAVELDTGLGRRAMLGVSIVDKSLLSLGRSRLRLGEVFDELSRRFLPPAPSPVEDLRRNAPIAGGLAPFAFGIPFGQDIAVSGSGEIFARTGLAVSASEGLTVPGGVVVGVLDAVAPIVSPPPPFEGEFNGQEPDRPRLRQFFPETWVWQPTLLTDEQGRARLELTAPDNITGWELTAVATYPDPASGESGIVFGESELIVFQDFFAEPALPASVVRGEEFPVKVDLFNFRDEAQTVEVEFEEGKGFELLDEGTRSVKIPANSAVSAEFRIVPNELGDIALKVTALGSAASDAVLRTLRVIPEGFFVEEASNGLLSGGETAQVEPVIPEDAVEGSARAFLGITPSPVAQPMQGLDQLIRLPTGCGEQNMLLLAPNIEVIKYLREIGELTPEIRAQAEGFINLGYQRQLTFQTEDGGFAAFGGKDGSLWLTAFVLSTFSGAREVRDIDENVLAKAAAMLIGRQRADGSFELDNFLIHTEMAGQVLNDYATAAFVANALAEYGGVETADALQRAATFLVAGRTSLPDINDNPFALAIAAAALQGAAGFESAAETFIDRLIELAQSDGGGIFWEPFPVETTGWAIRALLRSQGGAGRPEASAAVDWLSAQRSALGGYGNTQNTVVALRALFQAARNFSRSVDLSIEIAGPNGVLDVLRVDASNIDIHQQVQLPLEGGPYQVTASGEGNVGYQLALRYNRKLLPFPIHPLIDFSLEYERRRVGPGEIVNVEATIRYTGNKQRTGMAIVELAVPTGFEPVQVSLDALLEAGTAERIERTARSVVIYLPEVFPLEIVHFPVAMRALFEAQPKPVVSRVYEYYDQSVWNIVETSGLSITNSDAPFVDGIEQPEAAAGERLVIRGFGFSADGLEVLFNGVAVEVVEVLDNRNLIVIVPDLPPGEVEITVRTVNGEFRVSAGDSGFSVAPFRLFFPLYATRDGSFTGFALANTSKRDARFTLSARDGRGRSIGSPSPEIVLQPGEQRAWLASELFAVAQGVFQSDGWVELVGDNGGLSSLYQIGGADRLDGASPLSQPAIRLWFPRIFQGPLAFRGQPAFSRITLVNPFDEPARVRLTLHAPNGLELDTALSEIEPAGALSREAGAIFDRSSIPAESFIRVDVTQGKGVSGFVRIELRQQRSLLGLTASTGGALLKLYSGQAVETDDFYTSLKLLNTSDQGRQATLVLVRDDGSTVSRSLALTPLSVRERDLGQLFDREPGETLVGSLRVEINGPGVIGDVIFGKRDQSNAAALPLQEDTFTQAVFGHLGDSDDFFSGIALLNPGQQASRVTMRVHEPDGDLRGEVTLELAPGQRRSRLISEWVAAAAGQLGGYVVVESDRPIVAQELMGARDQSSLSAVPPTVLRE